MEGEPTFIETVESTKEIGREDLKKDMVFLLGQMVIATKANFIKTNAMVSAFKPTPMNECTKATGIKTKKHGFGIMYWSNGEKTQGFWQNSLLSGTAIFIEVDGKRYEERWKGGNREGGKIPLKRTESEMQAILKSTDPPLWIPDAESQACYKCDAPFTLTNRRHHCRHCGYIFCSTCTTKKLEIARLRFTEPVRVCDECAIAIQTADCEENTLPQLQTGATNDSVNPASPRKANAGSNPTGATSPRAEP